MNGMRYHITAWIVCLSLVGIIGAAQTPTLPDIEPPFKATQGTIQPAKLKMGSFVKGDITYEQPSLWIGNKRIGVRELYGKFTADRDQIIGLIVDGREIMRVTFWGAFNGKFGYPFQDIPDDPHTLTVDRKANTITYRKPYHLPDAKRAVFSYTLKPGSESQVILQWDMGISQEQLDQMPKDFDVSPWFIFESNYRHTPIQINGKIFSFTPIEQMSEKFTRLLHGKSLSFLYAPNSPLQQFGFTLPPNLLFRMEEKLIISKAGRRVHMIIRAYSKKRLAQNSLTFDFAVTAQRPADAPPPLHGVDFWGRDALHVPAPTTRNIMPNPSFEQGLRYWNWWYGGGRYEPSGQPTYSLSDDGTIGPRSLHIRPTRGRQPMQSFSIPVKKNATYTVSFYAKGQKAGQLFALGAFCPLGGSAYSYKHAFKDRHVLTEQWKRYSFTYDSDQLAMSLLIAGNTKTDVWVDGIQIEQGKQLTDFVSPQVEGQLLTSDPDNTLESGKPIDARLKLVGQKGVQGQVELTLLNFFQEPVYTDKQSFTLDDQGQAALTLALDPNKLGRGIFVLKARYLLANEQPFSDYYRLDIMDSLKNQHPTKDLFGSLFMGTRITRGDDLGDRFMRWGLGSTSYSARSQAEADLLARHRIDNMLLTVKDTLRGSPRKLFDAIMREYKQLPDDIEKTIEQMAYEAVKTHPWVTNWSLNTETESSPIIRAKEFDQWVNRIMIPAYRGIKRANPKATVYPDGGTSGYSRMRGHTEMEGYLKASQGKVRWDAIAVHPYWNLDGVKGQNDWDQETQRLIDQMAKYGYGKDTPIDYTECFNDTEFNIPQWGAGGWYDKYNSGKPTYAWGWKEYIQASHVSRLFIMSLKYWPQLRSTNIWVSRPFMDLYLTPIALCKIPNTLGHLFAKPTFKTDIRPAGGIRGYAFENERGQAVIAIWCTIDRVEEGLERGPKMLVDFGDKRPGLMDLMGNPRTPQIQKGKFILQLSPAPIFILGPQGSVDQLADALNNAQIIGTRNVLNIMVNPTEKGLINAVLKNQTHRKLTGKLATDHLKVRYDLPPQDQVTYPLNTPSVQTPGKMYTWNQTLQIKQDKGPTFSVPWKMQYFHVPHAANPLPLDPSSPQWSSIPSIAMNNVFIQKRVGHKPVKGGYPGDLDVKFQLAWDSNNLYLRLAVKDDKVVLTDPSRWQDNQLYMHDGCVEFYLDTAANGRSAQTKGFDADDYRYDFYAGNSKAENGPGSIYRLREPFQQFAGGLEMPTKDQAAQGVKCQYQRTADGYAYVMIFPSWYIQPMRLEKGWLSGFGLFIHDIDDPKNQWPRKGMSLATEPGAHCDKRPDRWPIMILDK